MNPLQTIWFLIFILPNVMIRNGIKMITKNMTKEDKKRWLWNVPYILLVILIILAFILWRAGYR